ncbi:MAG: UDP-N-acetylmuramoyl-L-alanyl-D-glutamate--2,6-diaminopimelate ligase [Deltaproteobacteria bacterium]|nr:UDP-N-acetylmuramoyl-L-alanyl-D-glutamate--2,6-diaminopimelate ligase [Deltaproteobacteria bacterium]
MAIAIEAVREALALQDDPSDPASFSSLCDDSRKVEPGCVFVAVSGVADHGREFVADALLRGAAAVVAVNDKDLASQVRATGAKFIGVDDPRLALARLARANFPALTRLSLTAVTGTNGKTTTAHIVESMLAAAGRRPGMVGTVVYRYAGINEEAPLTTPGSLALHELFDRMVGAGCCDVVLEASSHALVQHRLSGCRFRAAALTNVTQDHLDYHKTMAAYFDAKAILFEALLEPDGTAVLQVDREDGRRMLPRVRGRVLRLAHSDQTDADVAVLGRHLDAEGLALTLRTPIGRLEVESHLVGDFNASNLLVSVGLGIAQGLSADAIVAGIATLAGVPGRLEAIENRFGVLCTVDYAHTPDALQRVLAALRPLCRGRLITVFGCGGDRDAGKRPIMGEIAARLSDVAIVTSDNPRTEDPAAILEHVVLGVKQAGVILKAAAALAGENGACIEPDRRAAIECAIGIARPGDVVLIAGKGHEDYQILGQQKFHFDDRESARRAFAAREGSINS